MLKKCKIIAGYVSSPFRLHAICAYKINTLHSAGRQHVDALLPKFIKTRAEAIAANLVRIRIIINQTVSKEIARNQRQLRAPASGWKVIAAREYSQQKRHENSETLPNDYRHGGYARFVINSIQVSLIPDKQQLNIAKRERYQTTSTVIYSVLTHYHQDESKTHSSAANARVEMDIRTLSGKYGDAWRQGNTQQESAVSQNACRDRTGYFEPAENPISPALVVKFSFTPPQNVTASRFSLFVITQLSRCNSCRRSFSRRLKPLKNRVALRPGSFSLISEKPANRIKPASHHLCDTLRATQRAISSKAIITVCN
ncbi:hypothetical protein [Kosakonia sp. R1.Fl]|uniref:hypothetical protein n=1 Tax=Kosakonia sp. R1.Fl TaxID=2928706 RepID=UPI00201E2472|nr:hypothetical protein [Kosakonia sp. R1.Fl]MCL6746785.1 hypothetical protein [Kosakonia sp. R1.Fl]